MIKTKHVLYNVFGIQIYLFKIHVDLQKAELEAEKEREEAIENFKKLDSNQDGVVDIAEIQSRETFDRDRNGEGA